MVINRERKVLKPAPLPARLPSPWVGHRRSSFVVVRRSFVVRSSDPIRSKGIPSLPIPSLLVSTVYGYTVQGWVVGDWTGRRGGYITQGMRSVVVGRWSSFVVRWSVVVAPPAPTPLSPGTSSRYPPPPLCSDLCSSAWLSFHTHAHHTRTHTHQWHHITPPPTRCRPLPRCKGSRRRRWR